VNTFHDYAEDLNKVAISMQEGEKEVVSDLTVIKACTYIEQMSIKQMGDALIYCAALNLCNTYVKQPNSNIGYKFKKDLDYLLSIVVNADLPGVMFDLQRSNGATLLVVQVDCVQFSFHNVPSPYKLQRLSRTSDKFVQLEWDGIRKQKCAETLFNFAIQCPYETTNLTFRGKPLITRVNKAMDNYLSGKSQFKDLVKYAK